MSISMKELAEELRMDAYEKESHKSAYEEVIKMFVTDAKQVGGNHYSKRDIQPWDIIEEYELDYWAGNVIKYVLRHKDKNGKEDLEKALHYLEYMVDNYK